jgi:methyl-accepting chemotaxis protein
MAQAIDGATKGSLELAGTVSNIQRATDETTEATEGVARQAEAITTHAHTMEELLSKFKLESDTANPGPAKKPSGAKMLKARK